MKKILLFCCAMILGMWITISPALAAESNSTETTTDSNSLTLVTTQCESEGFHPNPNDCQKFYRCVDNGDGSYRKYDFECGTGTVWDEELVTCNYPYAISKNSQCLQGK
ncbi:chitin binding peritrophin-A domain-containing protein [Anabaena catenula]|uniref:Chitin binding domain-containing protein n=1 Tax=Anabaena catenula FACHB-362 TaxID=2692877 RepID=A0ABR8J9P5_9NOST|nr:chitin binding peritrophin-A domain-containing protein [Anabaena catenula]MBD2694363.1 chitin binding domain-containing protein [Anabaena catenula FACHB-362]